jgi:hypothetical protein
LYAIIPSIAFFSIHTYLQALSCHRYAAAVSAAASAAAARCTDDRTKK